MSTGEFLFDAYPPVRVIVCWRDEYDAGQWVRAVSGYQTIWHQTITRDMPRIVQYANVTWELFQDGVMDKLREQP